MTNVYEVMALCSCLLLERCSCHQSFYSSIDGKGYEVIAILVIVDRCAIVERKCVDSRENRTHSVSIQRTVSLCEWTSSINGDTYSRNDNFLFYYSLNDCSRLFSALFADIRKRYGLKECYQRGTAFCNTIKHSNKSFLANWRSRDDVPRFMYW